MHGVFQFTLIFPKWFFSVSPCPRRCATVHEVMHLRTLGKMVGQCTTKLSLFNVRHDLGGVD